MKELLRKFQLIASLALGSAPVAVLVFTFMEPSLLFWAWLYPVAYGVLCVFSACLPPKARLPYGLAVTAASLALPILLTDPVTMLPLLIAGVFYGVVFLWSLTVFGWQPNRELPDRLCLVCFILHLVAQFVIFMDRAEAQPRLTDYAPGLHAAFVAFLILLPLAMNRSSIHKASTKSRSVPDGMRRKNTLMTVVLVALACGASFVPYIYDWVKEALFWFVRTLMKLLSWKPADSGGTPMSPPAETVGELLPVTKTEPGVLVAILEAVLLVLGILIMVGVLVLVTVLFVRKLMGWMQNVWAMLERYASAVAEDYEDEITDIRKESLGEGIRRQRRAGAWRREQIPTDPGENVRHRYRWLLRKHPKWTASATARENMPKDLAELYEKARYSDHTITQSEAELFRTGTKEMP